VQDQRREMKMLIKLKYIHYMLYIHRCNIHVIQDSVPRIRPIYNINGDNTENNALMFGTNDVSQKQLIFRIKAF